MHKNLYRILIISTLILVISACSGGNRGSVINNDRRIPPTSGQITIPSNFITTASSNLFIVPLENKSGIFTFYPIGFKPRGGSTKSYTDDSQFASLIILGLTQPIAQVLSNAGNNGNMTATIMSIAPTNKSNVLVSSSSRIPILATNMSVSGTIITADVSTLTPFDFDNDNHTLFYTAAAPASTKITPIVAAGGTITGITDLWYLPALSSAENPKLAPTPAGMSGSACAPGVNVAPTALNSIPAGIVPSGEPSFVVAASNGNICSFNNAQQKTGWSLLASSSSTPGLPTDTVLAIALQNVDDEPAAYFQTNTGRVYSGEVDSNTLAITQVTELTTMASAPKPSQIAAGTMYIDQFGDVFVGGKDNLGRSVVYAFNSYYNDWETISLEQDDGVPELEPVVSMTPSLQGTIIIGTGTNSGIVKNIYELIIVE